MSSHPTLTYLCQHLIGPIASTDALVHHYKNHVFIFPFVCDEMIDHCRLVGQVSFGQDKFCCFFQWQIQRGFKGFALTPLSDQIISFSWEI